MSESATKTGESNDVANQRPSESSQPPEPEKEMRAVVLTSHGGLKGIRVMNRSEPVLSDGEVAIRVKCW